MTLTTASTQLINDIGKALTLRVVTEGSYAPRTGAVTGQSTADTSVKGMLLDYNDRERDGTLIKAGDRKIVIRASDGVVPSTRDFIRDGSVQYSIISVRQIEEAGTDVVYICQGRQ